MLRIFAIDKSFQEKKNLALKDIKKSNLAWYWVDFHKPTENEIKLLSSYFKFHHLAIEDCIHSINKPKLDYYEGYNFFILNALNKKDLTPIEVSMFVGENFIVSYHDVDILEIDEAFNRVKSTPNHWDKGPAYVSHQILDEIVDQFFPAISDIEDALDKIDNNSENKSIHKLIDEVFAIRSDLLKLRRVIYSMRDLLYRILNSERLNTFSDYRIYFSDVYDHLLKLSEMVEANRDMTSDIRDSYISINSNKMNTNMMLLTVITSIFAPITFIAGVYGMNFKYMPELDWKYGYFVALGVMGLISVFMYLWFKRKGWFDK
ncbi:magnesium transporter [Clostridium punense]|uniref:Magnesium transport protein CorA n=1 Tax=Clostridium punense TaxID=1054297 RepID=A0ABS4K0S2_9CLOT|nr:magnesium/cobalt transporter CorA [Clostridium punense]MBP2021383.1 magnesium transporter [Clostridium punense]